MPAVWNVPIHRNPHFTGREDELKALESTLQPGRPAVIQALAGLGGVGKTQLALEFAYRNAYRYNAVLWVLAATSESLSIGFASLAAALNLPEKEARELPVQIQAVHRELAHRNDWLLIFDNAEDPETLMEYLPQGGGPDHPQIAIYVNNLGFVLQRLGDLTGAIACFERVISFFESIPGPDHPDLAGAINNVGLVLLTSGDLQGAKICFDRALRISEAAYGIDHPNIAIHVNNLGRVLNAQGDAPGAKACYERALGIAEVTYG